MRPTSAESRHQAAKQRDAFVHRPLTKSTQRVRSPRAYYSCSLLNPPRFRFAPPPAKAGKRRIAATGCQALFNAPLQGQTHTFANAPNFRKQVAKPAAALGSSPCASVVSHYRSNPTHRSPPLGCQAQPVPPELVGQEDPRLDYRYCATWRHCLSKTASLSAFRRFQGGDVPEPFLYSPSASSTTNHGFMPMAPRCSAQHPRRVPLQV